MHMKNLFLLFFEFNEILYILLKHKNTKSVQISNFLNKFLINFYIKYKFSKSMLAENFFHSPRKPTNYILKINLNIRPITKKSLHR